MVKIEFGDTMEAAEGQMSPGFTPRVADLVYVSLRLPLVLEVDGVDFGLPDAPILGFCYEFLNSLIEARDEGESLIRWAAGEEPVLLRLQGEALCCRYRLGTEPERCAPFGEFVSAAIALARRTVVDVARVFPEMASLAGFEELSATIFGSIADLEGRPASKEQDRT
jgi:hypothetical protein